MEAGKSKKALQELESEAGACCGPLGGGRTQGRLAWMGFTQLPRVPLLLPTGPLGGTGRGEIEEVNPALPPAQPNLKKERRNRERKRWKRNQRSWGVGERQRQSKEFPSNQSLKMFMAPPLTFTLFFGWAFLSFPLREVGTGAQPRQCPAGPSCNSQDQRTKEDCWGDKGALFAYCSASMGFCLSPC